MSRYREELEAKPERDPVVCERCDGDDLEERDDGDLVATPAGPLCQMHADELAEEMR